MINHSAQNTSDPTNVKALKISAVLIFIYFFAEIAVALKTGSLSLLADAAHELSTVVAISISLIAIRLAASRPTSKRTFGLQRAEIIAALVNGFLLLGMAAFIIINGVKRLAEPIEMSSTPMLIMALGGIGLEIATLFILYKGQKGSLNVRGSFWHVINAFLGSVAVIIAALFIQFAQIYQADTWAGLIFAVILIYAGYGIIRDSLRILIDAVPADKNLDKIQNELEAIPSVVGTHHLHARTITGAVQTFSGHLIVSNMIKSPEVLAKAKKIVEKKYGFTLSTIQIEDKSLSEHDPSEIEYQGKK